MPEQASVEIEKTLVKIYALFLMDVDQKKDYELITALCFLDDCLEYGTDSLFNMVKQQALPKLTEILEKRGSDNQDLVQNCIYGMGILAQRIPAAEFAGSTESVLKSVQWVIEQDFKTDEEDGAKQHECVDNAISTLGKVIYFHGNIPAQVVNVFLSKLPISTDTEEAQAAHLLLIN